MPVAHIDCESAGVFSGEMVVPTAPGKMLITYARDVAYQVP